MKPLIIIMLAVTLNAKITQIETLDLCANLGKYMAQYRGDCYSGAELIGKVLGQGNLRDKSLVRDACYSVCLKPYKYFLDVRPGLKENED